MTPPPAHLDQILYSLPDTWLIHEDLQVDTLRGVHVLMSTFGVLLLHSVPVNAEIEQVGHQLLVNGTEQGALIKAVQQAARVLKADLASPVAVTPVVLYRTLRKHDQQESIWDHEGVKLLGWPSLATVLQRMIYQKLSQQDVMLLDRALRKHHH